MTADDGQVVEGMNYDPFGSQRGKTGTVVSNYLYTDQEYDPETGLYYYGARYYDPVIGRFISPDSIVQDPYDPQTLNRYTYCRNNPMIYTDPTGHYWWVPIILGAVYGGVSAAISGGDVGIGILTGALGGALFAGAGAVGAAAGIGGQVLSTTQQALLAAVLNGAAGLFAGAINSAFSGGADGGLAALSGLVGGASGGLAGGIQNDFARFTISVASAGVVSGIMAELSGAKFSEGAIPAMVAAAASYGIGKLAKLIEEKNREIGITLGEGLRRKSNYQLELDWERIQKEIQIERLQRSPLLLASASSSVASDSNPLYQLPKLPTFSESFPNWKFVAPVADIVAGGLEGGFAITFGVAGVVGFFAGPEAWWMPILFGPAAIETGVDSFNRISTGIERLNRSLRSQP